MIFQSSGVQAVIRMVYVIPPDAIYRLGHRNVAHGS